MPTVAFNICCPRDCVSRYNGGTSGAFLKPLRDDSALRVLTTLRGLRGAPVVPPLCRETQSLGQQMLELSCENATVGTNGLIALRAGSDLSHMYVRIERDTSVLTIFYLFWKQMELFLTPKQKGNWQQARIKFDWKIHSNL